MREALGATTAIVFFACTAKVERFREVTIGSLVPSTKAAESWYIIFSDPKSRFCARFEML